MLKTKNTIKVCGDCSTVSDLGLYHLGFCLVLALDSALIDCLQYWLLYNIKGPPLYKGFFIIIIYMAERPYKKITSFPLFTKQKKDKTKNILRQFVHIKKEH